MDIKTFAWLIIALMLCGCSRQQKLEGSWDVHHDSVTHVVILHEDHGIIYGTITLDPEYNKDICWSAGTTFNIHGTRVGNEAELFYESSDWPMQTNSTWHSQHRKYNWHIHIQKDGFSGPSHMEQTYAMRGATEPDKEYKEDWTIMGIKRKAAPSGPFYVMQVNATTGLTEKVVRPMNEIVLNPNTGLPFESK